MQKALRFLLGGGIGVAAYYLVLYLLVEKAGLWYVLSSVVAFCVNISINFTIHKFWTFRELDMRNARRQMLLYITSAVVFLLLNTTLLWVLVEFLGLKYMVAQVILTVVLTALGFFVTRRIFTPPVIPQH